MQPLNALPVFSWYDDPKDEQLPRLATLLEKISHAEDVRTELKELVRYNRIFASQEQIYLRKGME